MNRLYLLATHCQESDQPSHLTADAYAQHWQGMPYPPKFSDDIAAQAWIRHFCKTINHVVALADVFLSKMLGSNAL